MTQVDFYSIQVKYSGSFDSYTEEEIIQMGLAKAGREMIDCFDETKFFGDHEAEELDGKFTVENRFPCNQIAVVRWSYIPEKEWDDEEWEDDDEEI